MNSGGSRGAPYVAVQVGACLTYADDQAAIDSTSGRGRPPSG